jgi:DNA (cytosine-5)-methyltransferase 1
MTLKSLELFSGAGGLALGLEGAGFENVGLVERNHDACNTIRLNRPQWNLLQNDIRQIDFSDFGKVDLVAGGPPCQPFSMGGKARGNEDLRDMFPQAVRAVRALQPQAFIFENVRGLLRPAFQNYVEYIRLQLMYPDFPTSENVAWDKNLARLQRHHNSTSAKVGLSYRVTLNLADAADYGVPQRRHRVFFVGFRSDLDTGWSFPSPTASLDDLLRAQYITKDYWAYHGINAPRQIPSRWNNNVQKLSTADLFNPLARWKTVRDAIAGLGFPKKISSDPNQYFQPGAKSYPGHTGSPIDEPSKALKAGAHGVPGGENMLVQRNGDVRYFTVRESARIQTFPDNFIFSGSWSESMRQLGNAVPVSLAQAVAESVAKHLRALHGQRQRIQSSR